MKRRFDWSKPREVRPPCSPWGRQSPPIAADQLRDALAMGMQRAILLQGDGQEWDPGETARAIVEAIGSERASGRIFDLLLFGNEAADTGDYQVPIRVAHALGWPVVTGIKALEVSGNGVAVRREAAGGWETFEFDLPAVIAVKEGLNLPRYPTVPGRLKAKKAAIGTITPQSHGNALRMVRLEVPPQTGHKGERLGQGPEAVPAVVDLLERLGVIAS